MQPTQEKKISTSAGMETATETVNRIKSALNVVPVGAMESGAKPLEIPQVDINDGSVESAIMTAEGVSQTQAELANAQAQKKAQEKENSLRKLNQVLSGKTEERNTLLKEKGVNESQQELNDLMSSISLNTSRLQDFDVSTEDISDLSQFQAGDRDITKGVWNAKDSRMRLERGIARRERATQIRAQIAQAELMQNNITAVTSQIDAYLEGKYAPKEQELELEKVFLARAYDIADTADKRVYDERIRNIEKQENLIADARDMVNNALPYATPAELAEITESGISPEQQYKRAQEIVARGLRQDRAIELSKAYGTQTISPNDISEIANLLLQGDTSSGNVRDVLTQIMQEKSIPASVRTNVGTVFDVANAIESLALANPEGEFFGLGAGGGWRGAVASPFVWALGSDDYKAERTTNRSNVESINLKVQQWASGAALTEEQTKQVEKITPRVGDSDRRVREKSNALYNYMLDITESQLVTAGYNIRFPSIDLYEMRDLVNEMSPEQKRIFEDHLQEFGTNTSTNPYGAN